MTPELRQSIVAARTGDYSSIMRTTLFGFVAVAAVVHIGPGSFSIPLFFITLTLTAYGVLGGGTALEDINNLKSDMTSDYAATTYGSGVEERDILRLKTISAVLISLCGLSLLVAIIF